MTNVPNPVGRWFSQRSLKAQILWLVMGVTLVGGALIGAVSYQRSTGQAMGEAKEWSVALARMTAHVTVGPLEQRDHPSLSMALQNIVSLPGVRSVQVVRPQGQVAMRVVRGNDGSPLTVQPGQEMATPPGSDHAYSGDRLLAYARLASSVDAAVQGPNDYGDFLRDGWVEVEFSLLERLSQSRANWLADAVVSLLLVMLGLWFFYLFLRRAIGPIRELARFSATLATDPGEVLRMRWGSTEVRELGRTLNWSSQELARRMGEDQQKLSRLSAILDTAADAIVGVRTDGCIASTNPAAERMFGRSAAELLGQPIRDFLVGMDSEQLRETMDNGMLIHSTQSRIGRVEINAIRHGGTEFPVEVLLGEIANDPDIRYTCIVRDLTDMKLAEEYLTLYGRVVDCTLNGIFVSDARRYPQPIVHVNPAFTRITGYAPHEVLGRDGSVLEGPLTDVNDLAMLSRTVQDGGEAKVTLKNYRKDGTLFHNKLSASPVRDASGAITHYINVIEDVSNQIEVKQKLIERTARLNATFDLSPDGFAVFDSAGELIASNPALRAMVGEVPSWCSLQRFDVWFKNLCDDFDTYRSITEVWNDNSKQTIVLARPTRKVLEREIRRNLGGSGETFIYFRDVTHQYEVDRIKSEFLATAAHELRTPLASILGFTELMIHRRYTEEKQKDLLQTVHRQGTLLSNLIQELLDLSRIEARQGKDFRIEATPLTGIVRAAIDNISHQDTARQVVLHELPALHVMADASKIEQALTNLLSNAFKYSPGGGEVRLEIAEIARDGEDFVVMRVHDQGMGMTAEQLSRAFERFYRADASGNIPGTGLGLNLVKEIAEIHGGSVELSSEPGVGTVASLWLKTARAPAEATA